MLLSWAVPKGPTLDPAAKRMAVHVEDHPLGYFDFEGVIPAGEYGGGDVIVWDWGTWQLTDADDPIAAVEAGDLHFDLFGEKLRGHFALVRRGAPVPVSSGCCSTSATITPWMGGTPRIIRGRSRPAGPMTR